MPILSKAVTWVAMVLFVVPLAIMLLASLPTGAVASIASHVALLVIGSAIVLSLRRDDD